MKLNHFSKTVVGLVRKANEDSIGNITTPNNSNINLRIVCDGMGGHIGGAKASDIAVKKIQEYFSNTPNPVPQIALNEAISFANIQIYGAAQAEPEYKGMGTTCTVLLESEGLIYIAHVGDSRIYIYTDQKLYRITKDHSYVQGLVDKGEITDQQMETHPKKNQLTRALGIAPEVEVEVAAKPILAKTGDSFLLCSDGLCGLINDKMINSVLTTHHPLEIKCQNLITMAEAAGGHDNISVDLTEVLQSDHVTTQFINKNNEDIIDTKTQQIVVNHKNQKDQIFSSRTNKIILSLCAAGALAVVLTVFQNWMSDDLTTPDPHIVQPIVEQKSSKIDTIKAVAESGMGADALAEKFKKKVESNGVKYCNDCPVFFKDGGKNMIPIEQYRQEKDGPNYIKVNDYFMVTVKDGIVQMPVINKTKTEPDKPLYREPKTTPAINTAPPATNSNSVIDNDTKKSSSKDDNDKAEKATKGNKETPTALPNNSTSITDPNIGQATKTESSSGTPKPEEVETTEKQKNKLPKEKGKKTRKEKKIMADSIDKAKKIMSQNKSGTTKS